MCKTTQNRIGLSCPSFRLWPFKWFTTSLIPAFSPRRRRIVRRRFENSRDWICRTAIRQTRTGRLLFPLLGERIKGEGGRQNIIHSGNHPSQNEYRKRVPVRLHQISVIASASCASPCEIMPAPRLPIVFAVFHRASHAPRCPGGIRNAAGRARHSVRAGLCVRTFGGQRTARPTSSRQGQPEISQTHRVWSVAQTKSVLKGRWKFNVCLPSSRRDESFMGFLPGTLSPANFRCRFAALRLGVLASWR